MTEPDVTLTDYVLGIECALFAWRINAQASPGKRLRSWMVLFFAAAAIAPLAGGTVHGFLLDHDGPLRSALWSTTMLAIGVTALSAWAVAAELIFKPSTSRFVARAALLTFVANAVVVLIVNDAFWVAISFYLPAALFLFLAFLLRALKNRSPGAILGAWGVALGLIAAGLQHFRIAIHPTYFNHNALFHVVQAVGFAFIFAAIRRLLGPIGGSHADAT